VRSAAGGFVGVLQQVPSAVSAIKVDGKRAYRRVRDGEDVRLAAREVTVHELLVTDVRRAGPWLDVDLSVRCSAGTYVRAVARDLGEALGVGGHLTALRRTAVGPFTTDDAHTLDELSDRFAMLDISEVARRCFPTFQLDAEGARDVGFGRALPVDLGRSDAVVAVFAPDGTFLALYRQDGDTAVPVAVLAG
jgi:tRNA pseudouridine55 synthase